MESNLFLTCSLTKEHTLRRGHCSVGHINVVKFIPNSTFPCPCLRIKDVLGLVDLKYHDWPLWEWKGFCEDGREEGEKGEQRGEERRKKGERVWTQPLLIAAHINSWPHNWPLKCCLMSTSGSNPHKNNACRCVLWPEADMFTIVSLFPVNPPSYRWSGRMIRS